MKRYLLPSLMILLVVVEVVLALWGPMAFVQKPSMIVALPFTFNLEASEADAIFDEVQEALARTRVFRVIPHELIRNYYFEREDNPDFVIDKSMNHADYLELAAELDIDRVAMITAYPSGETLSVSVNIRSVGAERSGTRVSYDSPDVASFLEGIALVEASEAGDGGTGDAPAEAQPVTSTFRLANDLREEVRGVSIFDNLVFALFAGQALLAVLLAFNRRIDLLNQILLVASLVLFLFAFVYAINASMDYVQRFIANKGRISLAESTATEQLYTFIRFAPLFLVNVFLYVRARVGAGKPAQRLRVHEIANEISRRWGLALVLLSSLLYSLSFPSFASLAGMPYLAWFALIPLLVPIRHGTRAEAVFFVVAFGALSTLVLNYWHGTYSYVSLAFSVVISTVFYLVFAPIFVILVRRLGRWGFLAAPALWVTFDFARSAGYIGYPWGFFGVSQYSFLPVIQIADLAGVWALTFLLVLFNAGIAWSLTEDGRDRWLPAIVGGGLLVLSLGYGTVRVLTLDARVRDHYSQPEPPEMRVVLLQQNTDPRKHDYRLSYETLVDHTNRALTESSPRVPDLVIWPEGGFKPDLRYWLDRPNARGTSRELATEFMEYTANLGTWLVTGSQDHAYLPEGEDGEEVRRNFNSTILMSPDGEIADIYHKMHLVPFTEHFPYKEELPWLAALLDKFDTSNWKQGENRLVYDHPVMRFFTPICFEDIFPADVRRFVLRGADLIANVSNDYWSLTPVEGKQHGVHAMFRAVENRLPMVRSTCSGLTTYITAEGRMWPDPPEYYTSGYLTVDIPVMERPQTFYTRAGDWLPWVSVGMSAAAAIWVIAGAIVSSRLRRQQFSFWRRSQCRGDGLRSKHPTRQPVRPTRAARRRSLCRRGTARGGSARPWGPDRGQASPQGVFD